MSRIHQILSKADRDRSTAGLTWGSPEPAMDGAPVARFRGDGVADGASRVAPDSTQAGTHPHGASLGGRPAFGVTLHRQLVAALDVASHAAEQYRALRARIAQNDGDAPRHVVAITSAGRGDGKTLTALNLAFAMAQEFDRRTLIIDGDLRHARLHALLGISREPGLADVLSGAASLDQALVALPGHRLHVLPAGTAHAQASELLGSGQMRHLIEGLRRHFDRVLVDTAAAQSADTGALEPCLDGLIVVVRAGHTRRPAIERALTAIPSAKLLGMVLNDSQAGDGLAGG